MSGRIKLLMMVVSITALLFTGCGKSIQLVDNEDIPAAPVEEKEEDSDSSQDGTNEVKWSKKIPSVFPENKYGKCVICQSIEADDDQGIVWNLYFTEMSENDVEDYRSLLEKKGWELEENLNNNLFYYSKDDDQIIATYGEEDGETMFGLFLNEDGVKELEDTMDYEDDNLTEEVEELNLSIPEDFPKKEIPLYEKGELFISQKITYDDDITTYIISYLGEDDFKTINDLVVADYKKLGYKDMSINEMGMMTIIMGNSDNWSFSVTIAQTDESDYPVDISYIVGPIE